MVSRTDWLYQETKRAQVEVAVARFDEVVRDQGIDMNEIGLVWMDTQGHEGRILAGADSLLRSSVPLVTEYWPYGLRRSACLDLFNEAVSSHYSTIMDIGGPSPVEIPARDVEGLERKCPGVAFTDLLLV